MCLTSAPNYLVVNTVLLVSQVMCEDIVKLVNPFLVLGELPLGEDHTGHRCNHPDVAWEGAWGNADIRQNAEKTR